MEITIINRIDIHIFSLLICLTILADMHKQDLCPSYSSRIYKLLVKMTIANIVLEAITWIIRGQGTPQAVFVFNTAYFMVTPLLQLFWGVYVEGQFHWKRGRMRKLFPNLCIPVAVAELMILINCVSPFVFTVDQGGHCYRLWGYPILMAFSYALFGYTFVRVVNSGRQLETKLFGPLLFFHFPPIIGGILQLYLYGASFIWAGATLSLLIGYLYIQNQRLITDYLTGAYNRLEIDRYLQQKIDSATDYPFVGILIDLDDFKKINDNYGHVVGDEILISTVKLLKNSITTNDFLARYGGDEFLIILNEKASAKTNLILRRIEENVEKYNQGSPYPFRLKLSIGYDWYDVRQAMSATDFLKHIDSKMYRSKKNKHR